MKAGWEEWMQYLSFLWELLKRDVKKKYYKSVLGVLWTLLNPLLMMLVMTIIFSTLFRRSIEHYPVYYMCAYILLNFNSTATTQSLSCMAANSGLLRKIRVPSYMFCLAAVGVNALTLLLSLIPLLLVAAVSGVPFSPYLFLLPAPLLYTLVFTTGLSLILSVVGVFFRDMAYLYGILYYGVDVFSPPCFIPCPLSPGSFGLWDLNPLSHFTAIMRDLVLYRTMPPERTLLIATCYSLLTLLTGIHVFRKYRESLYLHL